MGWTRKRGCVRLTNTHRGIMTCEACGESWSPAFKHGGGFYRGAWQCPNGCNRGKSK